MMAIQRTANARDLEAAEWCVSLAEGELDRPSRAAFEAWIEDETNAVAFDEALRVWRAAAQSADAPEVLRLRQRALKQFQRAQGRRWRHRLARPGLWAAAAACVGVLIVGFSLLNTPTRTYRTGVGERQIAVLADGSRISLDADTEVRVRLTRERRDLTLQQGRAKFDVARDPLRPFAVTAGDKVVVATGTSFSVELLRREARVLLYEGHVAVMDKVLAEASPSHKRSSGGTAPAYAGLEPGRELVAPLDASSSPPRVTAVDPARSLSWEGGQLNFEDEPLASAVERINRYSERKVRLADPTLEKLTVNGVFDAGDIDAFLEAVTTFNRLRVAESDDAVTLRPS